VIERAGQQGASGARYVLVTPARDEELFIRSTLEAVCRQTVLPQRWVVVDDGSTDRTADIADEYARQVPWIEVLRRSPRARRDFAGKADAFNAGYERVRHLDFEFVGTLDADVTFEPDYFEYLLDQFRRCDALGVAGTAMVEAGYDPLTESFFNENDVFGACQLFRRACFADVGGYTPVRGGGIDWIAIRTARMKGWRTRCFMDRSFHHHRPMGQTGSNVWRARFEYGQKDYYLGNHPLWEVLRVGFQMTARPYVLGGLLILAGYVHGIVARLERPLSPELMRFHRKEQLERLRMRLTARFRNRTVASSIDLVPVLDSGLPEGPAVNRTQSAGVAGGPAPGNRDRTVGEVARQGEWGGVEAAVRSFVNWLDRYGQTSLDFQSLYAGRYGRFAKALYYRHRALGTLAVAPLVFSEAVVPAARALFWARQRFPIADAHYAMAFARRFHATGDEGDYRRAVSFLEVLLATATHGRAGLGWGYPFDWVTIDGTIRSGTPLITTLPYVYEAFLSVFEIDGQARWREVMKSIAEHCLLDYRDHPWRGGGASCSYTPLSTDRGLVVNASAYRAFLLTRAGIDFGDRRFSGGAESNLSFVQAAQNNDGSWFYAVDGRRSFIDHYHTCFVLKALLKISRLTGTDRCRGAIDMGLQYYIEHLFDGDRLPKPFARAPRITTYRRELYDYAECINVLTLARRRTPELHGLRLVVVDDVLNRWQRRDGSFRTRKLVAGWDNVPMHRWGQSQLFRSLCGLLVE
jgi:hypothetical protein